MKNELLGMLTATAIGSGLLLGCPGADADYAPPQSVQNTAGSTAIAEAIAEARGSVLLPPPPSLETLCSLGFGSSEYEAVKKVFGQPADESMDKSQAGLSYRYRGQSTKGNDGSITLVLTFDWSDGKVGPVDGLPSGYILSGASITGMPYPGCWPHVEL